MRRRAQLVDDTRRRITEAAVRLHTSVGPSETSFAAVADEAGVTRLTLYRHFASHDELFAACMNHWRTQHPPPDVEAWGEERSLRGRLRRALDELYAWYADNQDDLYPIYRDGAFTPASTHDARRRNIERMTDAILGSGNAATAASSALRAALNHVLGYWTWRSLAVEESCTHLQAVDLALAFVFAARRPMTKAAHAPRSRSSISQP